MTEIVFYVTEDPEGGFSARAANAPIFTQGDDMDSLNANIRDAVRCHFDADQGAIRITLAIR